MAVTADDIREALQSTYKEPEWFLGFEVSNSTGANIRRYADAVAMNTFPSRGYEVRGFEIKVSKSDLKRELENGLKADEIARFCNYWFLVVPKGLADEMQIPEPWGIIEYSEGHLRQKKKAQYFDNQPDKGFLVSFMRGCERVTTRKDQEYQDAVYKSLKQRLDYSVKYRLEQYEELKKQVEDIRKQTKVDITYLTKRDIRCLGIARHISDVAISEKNIDETIKDLTEICERLKQSMKDIKELTGIHGEY